MQYICENHFQRLSKTSMFTGLKAVNHFGRPDMSSFLKFVQKKHSYVSSNSTVTFPSLICFFLLFRCRRSAFSHAVRDRSPKVSCRRATRSTRDASCRTSSITSRISDKLSLASTNRCVHQFSCKSSRNFNLFLFLSFHFITFTDLIYLSSQKSFRFVIENVFV